MKREVYVMYDMVSQAFGEPFTMANAAEMRRQFEQTVADPAVPVYAIRDVCVIHLGTFVPDPDNPCIVPEAVASVVLRGGNYNVEEIRRQSDVVVTPASELSSV